MTVKSNGKSRALRGQDAVIAARYRNGETTVQIAATYDAHPSSIRELLIRNGVEMRPRNHPKVTEARLAKQYPYLLAMTPEQRADYRTLQVAGVRSPEALQMIFRERLQDGRGN